ncbi:MAG: hypothetical protein LBV02_03230 [Bacteroidales bacterium]|jgi:hypothetical protein|nr:hypothetical protein [Bacteroidales bacterium]
MKKIRFIYPVAVSVFLTLLLPTCDTRKAKVIAEIDQESKNYCLFGQGSYWIYQDSATLETDRVVISNTSYEKITSLSPSSPPFGWEEYVMEMNYFLQNNTQYEGSHMLTSQHCDEERVNVGEAKPIMFICSKIMIGNVDFINNLNSIYHNGDIEETYKSHLNSTREMDVKYETYFPNLQVGRELFSHVKLFTVLVFDYSTGKYHQIKNYTAKYVGTIRTEIISEDMHIVRNLIGYNVKPYNP